MLTAVVVILALVVIFQANRASGPLHAAHLITERLELRDDHRVPRLLIEQDPPGTGRQSRTTGITLYDRHGHERGGLVTYDDDRVGLALDAGVGAGYDDSLRDRLGLSVSADGAASVVLTDNLTRGVVRLHSDGDGGGGVQTMKWDLEARRIHLRTCTYGGEVLSEQAFGEPE